MKEVQVINPKLSKKIDDILRVAAYCRVSTDSDDQMNSFIAQVKYYNDFISRNKNMVLVDIYADEGITGTCAEKRDEFLRMVADAKKGKIDRILVKSVSRFARNALECIENIRLLKSYGTTVLFENDNIDTETMNSEMILYVKSAFAQSEAMAGSKRVSTAVRMRMERGEFKTTTAPYGYDLIDGNLVPNEEQLPIVQRIFKEYLSGNGMTKVAEIINEEEQTDRVWDKTAVQYVLKNEKYIGDSLWQKSYTPHILPFKKHRNRGQVEKFYVTNTHQGIVSKEEFKLVQEKIAVANEPNKSAKRISHTPFDKKIYCGDCGWSYGKIKSSGELYWGCIHDELSSGKCEGPNIKHEILEKCFVRAYNKLRLYENEIVDKTLSQLIAIRTSITSMNEEISSINREIAILSEQNSMYNELKTKNIIDDVSYYEKTTAIMNRLNALRDKRLKLIADDEDEMIIEKIRKLKSVLEKLPSSLFEFDDKCFGLIVEKVFIYPDNKVIFELFAGIKLGVDF